MLTGFGRKEADCLPLRAEAERAKRFYLAYMHKNETIRVCILHKKVGANPECSFIIIINYTKTINILFGILY